MDNWKKRLLKVVCIMAAFAVSFSSVKAESDEDYEDYPSSNSVYIEPWQQEIILNLLKSGAEFPASDVITDYELTSTGSLNLSVQLVSYDDEDGTHITFSSMTDINHTVNGYTIDGSSGSYLNVPKLTFKTMDTNSSYAQVQNTITCNKTTATAYSNYTINSGGTGGTITNLPNYSCTYSPYEVTTLDSYHIGMNNISFSVDDNTITGYENETGMAYFYLNINTDGTISGSVNIDTVGQSKYSNYTNYSAPYLDITNLTGPSSFTFNNSLQLLPNTKYVFFYSSNGLKTDADAQSVTLLGRNGDSINATITTVQGTRRTIIFGLQFQTTNDRFYSINWGNFKNNKDIYVYYFGTITGMPDDLYRYIYNQSQLEYLTEHGNTGSQNAVATAATTTNQLDNTSDQLHQIDTGYLDSADQALTDLDTSSVDTLLSTSDFLATANWLSTQITNFLGVNSVFSTVVYFSLVLGIILVVLGRMR